MYDTLFFGSIGTLVETTDMQRRAFNIAFREAGLDWNWSTSEYIPMLKRSGGQARIERYASARETNVDAAALHQGKVDAFARLMKHEGLSLRPGARDLMDAAKNAGLVVGFVTSTGKNQTDAIFEALDGVIDAKEFDYIGDRSRVARSKPASDIYLDALQTLNVSAKQAVAIEDTPICAEASIAARIGTIGFPNSGVGDTPFPHGVTVVQTLSPELLQRLDLAV